jgi:hypothetical protein
MSLLYPTEITHAPTGRLDEMGVGGEDAISTISENTTAVSDKPWFTENGAEPGNRGGAW